jgi:hypothetical protein
MCIVQYIISTERGGGGSKSNLAYEASFEENYESSIKTGHVSVHCPVATHKIRKKGAGQGSKEDNKTVVPKRGVQLYN